MQLSSLYLLLSFTTCLHISSFLASANASPLNTTAAVSNPTANSADAIVYKAISYCKGHLLNPPNNNCNGPCTKRSGWLNPTLHEFVQFGTNCVDTDGSTSFWVCDGEALNPTGDLPSCTLNTQFHPRQQPNGRRGYNTVGTNQLPLFLRLGGV